MSKTTPAPPYPVPPKPSHQYWIPVSLHAPPPPPSEPLEHLPAGQDASGRTLRIALAMKGGVSLAVWIGGGVAEIDVLRRIRIRRVDEEDRAFFAFAVPSSEKDVTGYLMRHAPLFDRAAVYARALHSRGFDEVEVDVLTGASAGGLNAVLYSVAQRSGADVDSLIGTWLDGGAIDRLLWTPGTRRVDSALRGDAFFWPTVHGALKSFRASPDVARHHDVAADDVVVDLSATLINPGLHDDHATRDGRGHLRFLGRKADPVHGRKIPGLFDEATERPGDLVRLAYAARTTSSFPGAFEPAIIASIADQPAPLPNDEAPDMSRVFAAHRTPRPDGRTEPYRVMDGGVLDNIPIERVLRSIRRQPADRFSARALIYLDPSPDDPRGSWRAPEPFVPANAFNPQPRTREDRTSRLSAVVSLALKKRKGRENTYDKLDEIG
ncbi:patatin-like phospholipase family protein, partial [uncultured Amnibacterium sp.]|uniref:patatin-like phospholipase family protein n=1 Tax=uncultured Amnibacterium sp. TaxID=1631851 RepID=UPI0035CC3119